MSVYNKAPYIDDAVRSILDQSYRDFDFVIYDDGSDDGSTDKLRRWQERDGRIRLHEGARNLGPAGAANAAVARASTPLIARMDADDLCEPDRLQQQMDLLQQRPDVGLVGTLGDVIDKDGALVRRAEVWRVRRSSWHAPMVHASILYRRDLFDAVGGYRGECEYWEDEDLIQRMARHTKVLIIPRALYHYRLTPLSARLRADPTTVEAAMDLNNRSIGKLARTGTYEDLLADREVGRGDVRIDPRVFISLGALVLWGGERPRLFRRLLSRGRLRPDMITASAMVWTMWASVHPASLRGFLIGLAGLRNWLSGGVEGLGQATEWTPGGRR